MLVLSGRMWLLLALLGHMLFCCFLLTVDAHTCTGACNALCAGMCTGMCTGMLEESGKSDIQRAQAGATMHAGPEISAAHVKVSVLLLLHFCCSRPCSCNRQLHLTVLQDPLPSSCCRSGVPGEPLPGVPSDRSKFNVSSCEGGLRKPPPPACGRWPADVRLGAPGAPWLPSGGDSYTPFNDTV